ncbi:MAG: hypothetical protein A2022_08245 [Deltaproteobacteria bacterium GWF2_42_12]|nr:MAG: hypothetical protein A2022_08245 [Deltaproteobacteria bacterium GWF2_42_12]OGQ26706.1 MAG: hypothetical protein A3D29_05485 [Deltaproteobacteria bacterium RIFCSPHIGHO2_02_FULL_42_44]OGQ38177.1 MAG: hypothetical protein A3H47_05765 [Deltaproteobacteria bacterium RIFCSPLOWO2_02_FULL_42_39]OGQ69009.1 MAG: hypothetical protein A3F88_09490 [Deltaproteobacteria bacterium RIFCSPLOWO2_12_FULL_42_16]OGQ75412.1 MAG: hypothetical protein A2235_05380 [Deltaproteobacteria bacterium RIFOXYA2_FULL_42_
MALLPILLEMQFMTYKKFLDHVVSGTSIEFNEIERKRENGEYYSYGDYEREVEFTRLSQEIAARAVFYEVNSLVEKQLQDIAQKAWVESKKHKGPKSIYELIKSSNPELKDLKMVSDLHFEQLKKIIEEYYNFSFKDVEGFDHYWELRKNVNSLKHCGGIKDFRKDKSNKLIEFVNASIDIAEDTIENTSPSSTRKCNT